MRKLSKHLLTGSFLILISVISLSLSGCAGKSTNMSLKEDTSAKSDNEIYSAYEGKYQLAPNFIITVTQKGDNLYAQATGQGAAQIYPKTEDKFFSKVVDAQIEFNRNKAGEVESLTLFQSGQEMPAKKIDE